MGWAWRRRERGEQPRLTVELVPQTCWFSNLRSELPPEDWDRLRRHCYRQARYRCQVCGGRGPKHPVECHELWSYDDRTQVQSLAGVIALCPACHEAKHIGAAAERGDAERARAHLGEINGWDTATLDAYLTAAFDQWEQRSRHAWQLDVDRLADYGIDPPGGDRLDEAEPGTLTIREVSVEETLENFFGRSRP